MFVWCKPVALRLETVSIEWAQCRVLRHRSVSKLSVCNIYGASDPGMQRSVPRDPSLRPSAKRPHRSESDPDSIRTPDLRQFVLVTRAAVFSSRTWVAAWWRHTPAGRRGGSANDEIAAIGNRRFRRKVYSTLSMMQAVDKFQETGNLKILSPDAHKTCCVIHHNYL